MTKGTLPPGSPLYCPYLVQTFKDNVLCQEYCLATFKACLIDDSALTRQSCTRRAWLDTCPEAFEQKAQDHEIEIKP